MPSGLLLLNKPAGVRSTVCVAIAKRHFKESSRWTRRTLISLRKGCSAAVVGDRGRAPGDVPSKLYEVTGFVSAKSVFPTTIRETFSPAVPDNACDSSNDSPDFTVRIQTPPGISAVRVDGKRAHSLVRSGGNVSLSGRPVFVRSVSLLPSESGRNSFNLRVVCGKGTYIRSIVRDIGRILGCGAHILRLIRKRTGSLSVDQALSFEEFQNGEKDLRSRIYPLSRFAENFYCYEADAETTRILQTGVAVRLSSLRFAHEGTLSPLRGTAVRGNGLFSFGRIVREGAYEPKINIVLEETE